MRIESGYNRERIWNEVAANLPLLPVGFPFPDSLLIELGEAWKGVGSRSLSSGRHL
jgi:hypothetical protein